jgi:1-acyl-sn-glycerol-3-phosphate acyltransferase
MLQSPIGNMGVNMVQLSTGRNASEPPPVSAAGARRGAKIAQRAARLLLATGADIDVVGADRVPVHGPLIAAGNHLSYVDGLLMPSVMPRLDVSLLVADEFSRKPFFHFFANFIGRAIYVASAPTAMFALRQAVARLRAGEVVLIAAEGEVSRTSTLLPAQPGIGYLAAVTGARVLPIATTGQEHLFANLRRFRRTPIRIEFGEPFAPFITSLTSAALAETSEMIMRRLAAMLPPRYRGVYADEPETSAATGATPRKMANPTT